MGRIVAFHFPARELERAAAFYTAVFGWELVREEASATPYTTDPTGTQHCVRRALIARSETLQRPILVIAVADVDATAERLQRLGGSLTSESRGAYRYASDPEGNLIGLTAGGGVLLGPSATGLGCILNVHLPCADALRASRFYLDLFGWQLRPVSVEPPYIVADAAQVGGPGIDAALARHDDFLKAPTPTIEVDWIDDVMTSLAMNDGQAAAVRDIPDVGRFGYAKDSEGNTIALQQRSLLLHS